MPFILFLVAVLSFMLIVPLALLFKLLTWRLSLDWFLRCAISIDQFINVWADDLFCCLLLTRFSKHPFGNEDETVSSVIGKNYLRGTLSQFGLFVRWFLNTLDKNHSVKAIERDEG